MQHPTAGTGPDPLCVLRGHYSDVTALAAHPERANLLASGDADGTLKLWDLTVRRPLLSERMSICGVLGVVFPSEEPQRMYTQGRDGIIKAWDLEALDASASFVAQRQPLRELSTGAFSFCCMAVPQPAGLSSPASEGSVSDSPALSSAGNPHPLVAACSDNSGVFDLWDMRSGEKAVTLGGERTKSLGLVMCLRLLLTWGDSAEILVPMAGYESGHVAIWDMRAPSAPVLSQRLHTEPATCMDVERRGRGGVCGSTCDAVSFFSLNLDASNTQEKMRERCRVALPRPGSLDTAVRRDCKIVAVAGDDNRVRVYSCKSAQLLAVLRHHSAAVSQLAFTSDHLLCASSRDGTVSVWRVYQPQATEP